MLTNNLIGRLGRPYEPRDGARWVASAQETPAPEPQPRETPRPATVTPFPRRAVAADVTVALPSGPVTFHVPAGSTILEAAEAADIALPHSCAVGGCGACLCALSHGSVHVPEDACLTDDERADGLTLPCVGQPTSPVVHLEPF